MRDVGEKNSRYGSAVLILDIDTAAPPDRAACAQAADDCARGDVRFDQRGLQVWKIPKREGRGDRFDPGLEMETE
jgi:hypothetical protein